MKVKIYHNKNFLNGRKIQLQQEEIHIWCIRWGEIIDFLKEKAYIMDCQEKEKAAQYRFYEDRMRYMAGKICTRILLMRYLNENSIVFLAHELGKTYHKKVFGKQSINFNISHSGEIVLLLFHAGTGTLTPYNALLSYIEKDSKENEAIIGFTFGDDADYISMETSQTFRLLGEKYGKILNKLGYSNYILIGHCVGGLIALETAQYLQKKNVQVSDVTLISSNIPKQKNQTILSQATDEIYRKTLQSSLDNEILLERIFAKLIGADAYKAGYQVDEERLQQYIEYIVDQGTGDITVEALCNTGGKFEDVAKEFRLLASKSVSERLNALYNIIERPNGELMEHQLKMLNILFRVFSQNFRCVSTYEPKPYYGNMRILCCEIQGGHFYPGFFAEDYETWKPYAKGNLTFDLIKGWHLDCITEPNLGENIKKMLDFNY